MAYILTFYVGYFVRLDQHPDYAEIQRNEDTRRWEPKTRRQLGVDQLKQAAIQFCGGDADLVGEWNVALTAKYVYFCEPFGPKAILWMREMLRTTDLDCIDGGWRYLKESQI